MTFISPVFAFVQLAFVIVFPVWWLLIEPLKVGLTLTELGAKNLRKVLER